MKNSTGSDNTLTVGPSYVCVYKNAIITQKHPKLVFSFANSLLKNVRIE